MTAANTTDSALPAVGSSLRTAIETTFGNFSNFATLFQTAGNNQFGTNQSP